MLQPHFCENADEPSRASSLRILVLFVILFSIGLWSLSCTKPAAKDNLILITLDTQRADFISAYGTQNASTPNIDALAQRGVIYENCYTLIPITLPAHASIFFSQPPHEIKNYNNGQVIRQKKKRPSFAVLLKKGGYTTAAFVSLGVLKENFGLDEGFDVYSADFPADRWYLSADEVNALVFPWLEAQKDQRFFLWIHYSDPHDPYAPPYTENDLRLVLNEKTVGFFNLKKYTLCELELDLEPGQNELRFEIENEFVESGEHFLGRLDKLDFITGSDEKDVEVDFFWGWFPRWEDNVYFFKNNAFVYLNNRSSSRKIKVQFRGKPLLPLEGVRELYKQEVEFMDKEIGKLWSYLEEMGLFEKTHIILVGDHGEGLGEYSNPSGDPHIGHIHYLNSVYMKVPLIVYDAHSPSPKKSIEDPVTLLDLAPTIMDLLGLDNLPNARGRSLLELESDEKFVIYEETYKPEAAKDRFAVLKHPWHIILTPEDSTYEVFDLRKDPEEMNSIAGTMQAEPEVIALKKNLETFVRKALKGKEHISIDKKTEEMLRSLGYIK